MRISAIEKGLLMEMLCSGRWISCKHYK